MAAVIIAVNHSEIIIHKQIINLVSLIVSIIINIFYFYKQKF